MTNQMTHHAVVTEVDDDRGVLFRWECNCVQGGKRQTGKYTTDRAAAARNGRKHETTKNAAALTSMAPLRALLSLS
jgi:hypothetical protein